MEKEIKKEKKEKIVEVKKEPKKKTGLTLAIYDMTGKEVGELELPKEIFGIKPNKELLAQAVRVYLANQRLGTASTKGRGEVRGGGRKPWKQKGTGRARIGSIRAPHWRGGGVVFGPHPKDYSLSFPKKMKKAALISALSDKFTQKGILVLNEINFKEPKTKEAAKMFRDLDIKGKTMVIMPEFKEKEILSLRNLPKIKSVRMAELNTYEVLNYKKLLFTKETIEKIPAFLLGEK